MGSSPRTQRPAPAPKAIAPVSTEDKNVKLAGEFQSRQQRRKKGRKSTLIVSQGDRQTLG